MRISTTSAHEQALYHMMNQQSQLSQTQQKLATGKRMLAPADDPAGAARAMDLSNAIARLEQFKRNTDTAQGRLELTESTIAGIIDALQRIRELTVQANNDSQDPTSRKAIAIEIKQRLDQLVQAANTQDANGEYLFSGHQTSTLPFVAGPSGFIYQGDQGQRLTEIADGRKIAIGEAGSELFQRIANGNGVFATSPATTNAGSGVIDIGTVTNQAAWIADDYTLTFTAANSYEVRDSSGGLVTTGAYQSGTAISFLGISLTITGTPASMDNFAISSSQSQDIFSTVQSIYDETLASGAGGTTSLASTAQLHSALGRGLSELDQILDHLNESRARIGSRLTEIDDQREINSGTQIQLTRLKSEIEDLDYASAISKMNRQLLGLQAAQQSFSKIQNLSLFNYL